MNIMDLFRPSASQANQGSTPAAMQPPSGSQTPGQPLPGTTQGNPTVPSGTAPAQQADPSQANQSSSVSPLDTFKDIWKTTEIPGANSASIFGELDPKKLMESASRVDFTKSLTPELLAKVQAGGAEGVQALQQAMNNVAQNAYAQNALATVKIVEQALSKHSDNFGAQLPSMVKKLSANESLLANNPLLSNPAIQPLVGALQEQLVRKNPNATAAEIESQVNQYFQALGSSFAPKTESSKSGSASKTEEDWGKFFE